MISLEGQSEPVDTIKSIVVDYAMCDEIENILHEMILKAVNFAYDLGKRRGDMENILGPMTDLTTLFIAERVKKVFQIQPETPDTPPNHPGH